MNTQLQARLCGCTEDQGWDEERLEHVVSYSLHSDKDTAPTVLVNVVSLNARQQCLKCLLAILHISVQMSIWRH